MTIVLAIVLALLFVGTLPIWQHSVRWGYYPSTGIGVVLAILIIYLILR